MYKVILSAHEHDILNIAGLKLFLILFWIQFTFVTVISNCSDFDMLKDLFVVCVMILSCILVV